MSTIRIVEIVLLAVAAVVLISVFFAAREHFGWLLAGFGTGLVTGVVLTVLIPRGLRGRKEKP